MGSARTLTHLHTYTASEKYTGKFIWMIITNVAAQGSTRVGHARDSSARVEAVLAK
jgi:hypothetical protein